MSKFCTNCGEALSDDAAFCVKCGTRVGEQSVQSAQEPSDSASASSSCDTCESAQCEQKAPAETNGFAGKANAFVAKLKNKDKKATGKMCIRDSFRTASLNMPAMQLVMYATILCILGFGGKLISIGGMEVGELTGFLSYVLQVLNSLMMISNVFLMMTRSLASCKRIVEVIDEKPALDDSRATDARVCRGSVSFRNVFFKYSDAAEEYVLSDINLEIAAGETLSLIHI